MNRTVSSAVSALILTLAGLGSACGEGDGDGGVTTGPTAAPPEPPSPTPAVGSIRVTVSTTGVRLDPDGFAVSVDGSSSQSVPVNGAVVFNLLEPGRHTIDLSGVAINCPIRSANPHTVMVTSGARSEASFVVECGFLAVVVNQFPDVNHFNGVSVIETVTNSVVATVSNAGFGPMDVAITPDGKFAFVANSISNDVSVIETASKTVVASVSVEILPLQVAITPF